MNSNDDISGSIHCVIIIDHTKQLIYQKNQQKWFYSTKVFIIKSARKGGKKITNKQKIKKFLNKKRSIFYLTPMK